MATVAYPHIELNEDGVPVISGTRTKVRLIALDRIARGWNADEIHEHYPYLTLGQIHSALAYYFDHKVEMDRDIEERYRQVQKLRASQGESPGRRKLRERGLLP